MPRKLAPPWTRFGLAAASWVTVAWLAQGAVGADIGRAGQRLEDRIEMQLRGGGGLMQPPPQPQRTHDDSPIEPWELVSV
jgi:hypothetical protein